MNVVNFEDGHCKRIRSYLDSYLSNELMVETNHEVLTHLETCGACSRSLEDRARLKAQLKRAVMQEYAPAALREVVGDRGEDVLLAIPDEFLSFARSISHTELAELLSSQERELWISGSEFEKFLC